MSKELVERLRVFAGDPVLGSVADEAADRIMELERELEREQMRLVACGVVAMCDTPESAEKARQMHPDYESASCSDVARRVDECIELRKRIEEQQKRIEFFEALLAGDAALITGLKNDLAASQAQIKVLREALEKIKATRVIPATIYGIAHKALAQPTDDSALRELLKAERERVAKVVRDASFKIQSGSPHRKIFDAVVAEIRAMGDR